MKTVTIHAFCTFIDRNFVRDPKFVHDKLDLDDIDWDQMISNSQMYGKDLKEPKTDSGKPLI